MKSVTYRVKIVSAVKIGSGRRLDVPKRPLYNRRGRRLDVPLLFFLFIRFYFLSLDLIVFTPILC